jgi:hypothetical protein
MLLLEAPTGRTQSTGAEMRGFHTGVLVTRFKMCSMTGPESGSDFGNWASRGRLKGESPGFGHHANQLKSLVRKARIKRALLVGLCLLDEVATDWVFE